MWALPQEVTFETAEDLKQVGFECIAQAEGDLQLDVGGVAASELHCGCVVVRVA